MHPKDADSIANSEDSDQRSLIWVCTICPDQSVLKLRVITVYRLMIMAVVSTVRIPSLGQIGLGKLARGAV